LAGSASQDAAVDCRGEGVGLSVIFALHETVELSQEVAELVRELCEAHARHQYDLPPLKVDILKCEYLDFGEVSALFPRAMEMFKLARKSGNKLQELPTFYLHESGNLYAAIYCLERQALHVKRWRNEEWSVFGWRFL
jgi:hypothetical protein